MTKIAIFLCLFKKKKGFGGDDLMISVFIQKYFSQAIVLRQKN